MTQMKVEFVPYGSPKGKWSFNILGLCSREIDMIAHALNADSFAEITEYKDLSQSIRGQANSQTKTYRAQLEEYRDRGIAHGRGWQARVNGPIA